MATELQPGRRYRVKCSYSGYGELFTEGEEMVFREYKYNFYDGERMYIFDHNGRERMCTLGWGRGVDIGNYFEPS